MRKKQTSEQELLEKLDPKPNIIAEVERRLERDGLLGINIGSLEGRFLQWLINSAKLRNIVEIGTQYGCSALWMAQAAGSGAHIYALEKSVENVQQALKTFSSKEVKNWGCRIDLLEGDAAESLKSIESEGPFDLVFIDANKSGYLEYYRWAKEFLKPGGYLVADNVYLFGTMFQDQAPEQGSEKMWKAMKAFLAEIFQNSSFHCSFIPTTEGLLVAQKK